MRRRERRPLLLTGLAAILIPAAAYLFFELGRFQAGYAVLDRQREFEEFENAAAVNEKTIDELKRQLAAAEERWLETAEALEVAAAYATERRPQTARIVW